MSTNPLGSFTSGITRLRVKGGASPDSLYDLVDGYVDQSGAARSRAGTTFDATLPAGTKGCAPFKGQLHVFALAPVTMPSALFALDIIIHPNQAFTGTLKQIHFAKPFLGFLYVVAEFSDGVVAHYWIQSKGVWTANTVYQKTDLVQPTVNNGFIYLASSAHFPPAWAPNVQTAVGAIVQPIIYNGFQYVCTEVDGTNPATGSVEPVWPKTDGAIVYDDNDATATTVTSSASSGTTGSPAGPRYDNGSGGS